MQRVQGASWPADIQINGEKWGRVDKDDFFMYEDPKGVRTTPKFSKRRLRSHVRIEGQPNDYTSWDRTYHVTFYAVSDGQFPEGVESGNSLCLQTFYSGLNVTGTNDDDDLIKTKNRRALQEAIDDIAIGFLKALPLSTSQSDHLLRTTFHKNTKSIYAGIEK